MDSLCSEENEDLPLMSNVNSILVDHYNFFFEGCISEKYLNCSVLLSLKAVGNDARCSEMCGTVATKNTSDSQFALILDSHQLLVNEVVEVNLFDKDLDSLKHSGINPRTTTVKKRLKYEVAEWCLKVWTDVHSCKNCFPKFVRISYKTIPESLSLQWTLDQDKNPSVFTYGAWVNNRALFPCQEPPVAMATWEATVSVTGGAIVLMSGDDEPVIYQSGDLTLYYYYTKMYLPLSTLCLAIGYWEEHVISSNNLKLPRCRIFSPKSLLDLAVQELFEYIPYCLQISENILDVFPFKRIDFLIVPSTFGSLGMASPNIIFLSQSVLVGDGSMCTRVAHEIAHAWFGLMIGALDWKEEWLSEGFATFMEDVFHARTMNMTDKEAKDYMDIKAFLRKTTLMQETQNTDHELQVLRPDEGKTETNIIDGVSASVLRNGKNPMKCFMQVHYIKGYFLLKVLCDMVGINSFLELLKAYIKEYSGQLVTSKEFLLMFSKLLPIEKQSSMLSDIYENWLHKSGISEDLENWLPSMDNKLFQEIQQETRKWLVLNAGFTKSKAKRSKISTDDFLMLTSDQIILLLEHLLEETLCEKTLEWLNKLYSFRERNGEVQHRWFELVVKYKCTNHYTVLKEFLENHLAMGVYLYSEMIFSEDELQQSLAKSCFDNLKTRMDSNYRLVIEKMILEASLS